MRFTVRSLFGLRRCRPRLRGELARPLQVVLHSRREVECTLRAIAHKVRRDLRGLRTAHCGGRRFRRAGSERENQDQRHADPLHDARRRAPPMPPQETVWRLLLSHEIPPPKVERERRSPLAVAQYLDRRERPRLGSRPRNNRRLLPPRPLLSTKQTHSSSSVLHLSMSFETDGLINRLSPRKRGCF